MVKEKSVLFLLVVFLVAINYSFLDKTITGFLTEGNLKEVHVDRIIDGDTIESGNQSIRLLGINTPERGEKYYKEAKEFLGNNIFNKTVQLEFGRDKKRQIWKNTCLYFLQWRKYKSENY